MEAVEPFSSKCGELFLGDVWRLWSPCLFARYCKETSAGAHLRESCGHHGSELEWPWGIKTSVPPLLMARILSFTELTWEEMAVEVQPLWVGLTGKQKEANHVSGPFETCVCVYVYI